MNIQKGNRLCLSFLCFLSCACLLMAAVPAARAASVPYMFYTFDWKLELPESGALSYLEAGVPVSARTYEEGKLVTLLKIVVHANNSNVQQFSLYADDIEIAFFSRGIVGSEQNYWKQILYQTLVFDSSTDIPTSVLDWMELYGTFSGQPPLIQIPSFDIGDILDEDIINNEYVSYSNIVGLFLRNNVTAPFVLTLFGLVLISFILYGKK